MLMAQMVPLSSLAAQTNPNRMNRMMQRATPAGSGGVAYCDLSDMLEMALFIWLEATWPRRRECVAPDKPCNNLDYSGWSFDPDASMSAAWSAVPFVVDSCSLEPNGTYHLPMLVERMVTETHRADCCVINSCSCQRMACVVVQFRLRIN